MKEKKEPRGASQATRAQEALPPWLRYIRDEEVVKAQMGFGAMLQQLERKLATVNHIQPKVLGEEYLIPLFAMQSQWFLAQTADILRWFQLVTLQQKEPDVVVGIDPSDGAALLDVIGRVRDVLIKVKNVVSTKLKPLLEHGDVVEIAPLLEVVTLLSDALTSSSLVEDLEGAAEMVSDMILEEEEEEEPGEDEEDVDDEEDLGEDEESEEDEILGEGAPDSEDSFTID